jgi:hypothetical protein
VTDGSFVSFLGTWAVVMGAVLGAFGARLAVERR